ncbi:MAG: nucleotidyltransferase domain-containing protein [Nitrospirae bacterium]|nr:nucleotidyltransferase domain-containing protein [Nitrospirota bacterium]
MGKIAEYRKYWQIKEAEEAAAGEVLRTKAFNTAKLLTDILVKEFGVKRVILFGSALQKHGFDRDSDIDLAVEGLEKRFYFRALARLMMESPFEVDLKPIESVKTLLKDRIKKGVVLYEKRNAS